MLHAIDMAGLALNVRDWNAFQPKLEIKDMFADVGKFEINIIYSDESKTQIRANEQHFNPIIEPAPNDAQRFKSVLILPDPGLGLARREHRSPKWIVEQLEARNYGEHFTDKNQLDKEIQKVVEKLITRKKEIFAE